MSQRDKPIDVLVLALLVERPVDGDAAELQDVDACEPRRRECREDSFGGDPQRFVQCGRSLREVERDRHDGASSQLRGNVGFVARLSDIAIEAAAPHRGDGIAVDALRPPGQFDLPGMAEFECELRGRGVAPGWLDFQTAQHDFLQP